MLERTKISVSGLTPGPRATNFRDGHDAGSGHPDDGSPYVPDRKRCLQISGPIWFDGDGERRHDGNERDDKQAKVDVACLSGRLTGTGRLRSPLSVYAPYGTYVLQLRTASLLPGATISTFDHPRNSFGR